MSEIFQLFECGDVFQFTDPADSYQTWQGLKGDKGDKGDTGATGPGLDMQGPVATTGDLPATAPSNELWLVGAAAPYHGWFYNGASWEDAGEIAIGPEGPPGQDGQDGAAATIAVGTVSSLPAGSTPTVVNSGTSAAAVFDFGIPEGDQGETGPAGPGVASGGTAGQILAKASATDYDTEWVTPKAALYFPTVSCSALTGDFATVSDPRITADSIVVFVEYAEETYITSNVTWTTSAGQLVLNGKCTAAMNCAIVVVEKSN